MKEDYPIINSKIKIITFEISKNVFNTSGNEITQDRDTPSEDIHISSRIQIYLVISSHIQSYLVISDGSIVLEQPLDVVRHLDEDTWRPGLAAARRAEYHDTCTHQYSVFTILQIFLYRSTYWHIAKILKATCWYHNPQPFFHIYFTFSISSQYIHLLKCYQELGKRRMGRKLTDGGC